MRIAYVGLDEVNRYFARKWARRIALGIKLVNVRALGVSARRPIVIDLDSLPAEHRHRWLGWLTSFACQSPALVFGHTLADDEAEALRGCGVRVIRRALRRSTLHRFIEREMLCIA